MLRTILLTALLSLLAACGQKGEVTKTEFVIAGLAGSTIDPISGALMITAYNPSTNQIFRKKMTASEQVITLPNGVWYFSALYWDNNILEGAVLQCGIAQKELNGTVTSIDLSLTQNNCKINDFNEATFLDAGILQSIVVNQCTSFGAPDASCALTPGSAQSFEIVFSSFNLSTLSDPDLDASSGVIKSACIDTGGDGENLSNTLIPSGSANAPLPFTIRTFYNPGCSGASSSFHFKRGLLSSDSANKRIHDFLGVPATDTDVTRILFIDSLIPQPPQINFLGATGTTGTVGAPMSVTPITLNTNGAAIINCAAVPALTGGLSINPSTCVISGTPSGTLSSTTYSITATNSAGSSVAATVTLAVSAAVVCPTNYALVTSNPALGVSTNFCVAKFEMKDVLGNATSQPALQPWRNIAQTDAKIKCTSQSPNHDLISNPEWMTIAYEIENSASNWSSGTVGTGMLNRGHSDNNPVGDINILAVTDASDPYNGTGNNAAQPLNSGREQKRTHTLASGEVIWDFAGNAWEWTDWTLGGLLTSGPTDCAASWNELFAVPACSLSVANYIPDNPAAVAPITYNSTYGLGRVFGGTGGAAARGGHYNFGAFSGVFSLSLTSSGTASMSTGFRCVYRP